MSKAKIKYCRKCGKVLNMQFDFHHYSIETGEKLHTLRYFCPSKTWYNLHTAFYSGFNHIDVGVFTPLYYTETGEESYEK